VEANRVRCVVDAAAALKDIRSGMSDAALMTKYNLSPWGLESLFNQLVALGVLRQINARELLRDIRSGTTNKDLMQKHGLSRNGLKKIFEEMTQAGIVFFKERSGSSEKKRIDVRAITEDILAGTTELQLMEKYGLSSRGLQSTFWKLVRSGSLTWDELLGIYPDLEDSVTLRAIRDGRRGYPILAVEVFEEDDPQNAGQIIDLSNKGFGAKGIFAEVNEVKAFVLVPSEIIDIGSIRLKAVCRWSRPDQTKGHSSAGFEIMHIDQKSSAVLDELLDLMTLTFE
jgi:DNA-binding transcriptional regulator YhcF (GntR family)